MAAQAQFHGRYLGGRPPYGYRLADAGPHPNPGKAAGGRRLHRLEPDPATAPVVVLRSRCGRGFIGHHRAPFPTGVGRYVLRRKMSARTRIPSTALTMRRM